MWYKREEAFRYTFDEPIDALFQIKKIDGAPVTSSEGEAKIIDISPEGLKLNSTLDVPEIEHKTIEISISFELNGNQLNEEGIIVWKKGKGTTYDYGIDSLTDESEKEDLIEQLKVYSRKASDG